MNLDFGILWIEDSFSPEEESALKRRVTEAGFSPYIDSIPNSQGLEQRAKENNLYDKYDFVLLDYKLQNELGDELALTVRELFPSTTILFYSGSRSHSQLRTLVASREVEGVYCSSRERFIERAGILIEQTAKSLNRLSGMRGLAMRVVADCDEMMRSGTRIMTRCDDGCRSKMQELDRDVLGFIDGARKKYLAATHGTLDDRLGTRAVDSAKLHKHFRRLTAQVANNGTSLGLDNAAIERLRELRRKTREYDRQVLKKRNILGHVRELEGADGWVLEGGDISLADFPDMRRKFAEHIAAFQDMVAIIKMLDPEQAN